MEPILTESPAMLKDPRDPHIVTPESVAYHKAKCEAEREAACQRVPELRRLLEVAQPLLTKTPLRQRHNCQMKVDEAIEQFGLTTVVQCLALVLAANGIDIATKTVNELAMGEERQ